MRDTTARYGSSGTMTRSTMVVGTETPSVTVGRRIEPQQGAVWHAVDPAHRTTLCGTRVVAIFDDLPWKMGGTSMLCQACVRAAMRE